MKEKSRLYAYYTVVTVINDVYIYLCELESLTIRTVYNNAIFVIRRNKSALSFNVSLDSISRSNANYIIINRTSEIGVRYDFLCIFSSDRY